MEKIKLLLPLHLGAISRVDIPLSCQFPLHWRTAELPCNSGAYTPRWC